MPSMMIAVSPNTLRNRSLSWVLKALTWASMRVWISAGGWLDSGRVAMSVPRFGLVWWQLILSAKPSPCQLYSGCNQTIAPDRARAAPEASWRCVHKQMRTRIPAWWRSTRCGLETYLAHDDAIG